MEKINFPYIYGNQKRKFQFYRIPKVLVTHEYFKNLSNVSILMYGLYLDRVGLSMKNDWLDKKGRVYIIYSNEDMKRALRCSNDTATKTKKELQEIGLIEVKRNGQGKPDWIFVKNFEVITNEDECEEPEPKKSENQISRDPKTGEQEIRKPEPKKPENQISRNHKIGAEETRKMDRNNTKGKETENNYTESSSDEDLFNSILSSIEYVKLQYVSKQESDGKRQPVIDSIYKAIRDVIIEGHDIGTKERPIKNSDAVKVYRELRPHHIENIVNRIEPDIDSIGDLRSYVEVALYREPQEKPSRRNSFNHRNERCYTKADYDEMMRLALTSN